MSCIAENPHAASGVGSIYVNGGLSPIPLNGKRPIDPGWQSGPIDAARVDAHVTARGNVGLRMGPQPDGRFLIAIDEDAPGEIARAEAALGALPETLTSRTGAGGQHRIFAWLTPEDAPRNSVRWEQYAIDIRSDGGQIVVAPSIHPDTGRAYEWIGENETIAELPAAWVAALRCDRSVTRAAPAVDEIDAPAAVPYLDALIATIDPCLRDGEKHDTAKAIAGWLRSKRAPQSAAEYVIRGLSFGDLDAKLDAALWAYETADTPPGWDALCGHLGPECTAAIDPIGRRLGIEFAAARARATGDLVCWLSDDGMALLGSSDAAHWELTDRPALDRANGLAANDRGSADCAPSILGRPVDLSVDPPPMNWLCEWLQLAPGKVSMLGGYASTGKGPFATLLAVSVATGKPLFGGHPVRKGNVLILDYETGNLAVRRLARITAGLGVDRQELVGRIHFWNADPTRIREPAWIEALATFIREQEIALVIVDSYTSASYGIDADSNSPQYARLAAELGRISAELDCVVLCVVHLNKGAGQYQQPTLSSVAGTNSLGAMAQTVIGLWREDQADEHRIGLALARTITAGFAPVSLEWIDGRDGELICSLREDKPARPPNATERAQADKGGRLIEAAKFIQDHLRASGDRVGHEAIVKLTMQHSGAPRDGIRNLLQKGIEGVRCEVHPMGRGHEYRWDPSYTGMSFIRERSKA